MQSDRAESIHRYPITLRPLTVEEGGGWLAEVPSLPGCMSDGETPQEAVTNVMDAIDCWLEAAVTAEMIEAGADLYERGDLYRERIEVVVAEMYRAMRALEPPR